MPFTAYKIGGRSWVRHRVSWPSELTFSGVRALSGRRATGHARRQKANYRRYPRQKSDITENKSHGEEPFAFQRLQFPSARTGGATVRPTYMMSNQQLAACRSDARMERADRTRFADGKDDGTRIEWPTGPGSRGSGVPELPVGPVVDQRNPRPVSLSIRDPRRVSSRFDPRSASRPYRLISAIRVPSAFRSADP
jgi:hypothetical protein